MRIRSLLYIVVAVLVGVLAMLNWPEITRSTPLNMGIVTFTAPLGLILLSLLVAVSLLFAFSSAAAYTRHLADTRQHAKALQAQRDLADKAETSRFVELRQRLDDHFRDNRERESHGAPDTEQTVARIQRELRQQVEQLHRALSTRMGEMEERLSRGGGMSPTAHVAMPTNTHVPPSPRGDEPATVAAHRETMPDESVRTTIRRG